MAYDQLEYAPNDWRNPITRNALKVFTDRTTAIQDKYLQLMARHISDIGRLTASDITRLEQMRRLSRNMNEVQKMISEAAHISDEELQEIFKKTCEFEGNDFLRSVVDSNNNINWQDNEALKTALQAQIRVTQGRLENFSNTTANSKPYIMAVDNAIAQLQTGLVDHNTVIRNAIRQCAAQGLTVVQYETKYKNGKQVTYHRRLDSAMRQNVLDGIRDLAQARMDIIGQETGCNGIEISAHLLCAEDHLEWQGQQMYTFEFEDIQSGLARPYGEWNCHHWWTPIVMGTVNPTYSKEELQAYDRYSREPITIENKNGKEITKSRYQWTQEQRRLETAVRQQKDLITAAKAQNPVDMQAIREAKERIRQYQTAYSVIGDKAGIGEQRWRMASYQGSVSFVSELNKVTLQSGKNGSNLLGKYFPNIGSDITAFEDIIKTQGYSGLPVVADKETFQRYVDDNNGFVMMRGYKAPNEESLAVYKDSFRNGEWYIKCSGGSAYGYGMYTMYSKPDVEGSYDEMTMYTGRLGDPDSNGRVDTMTLMKDSNIISYDELSKEYDTWKKSGEGIRTICSAYDGTKDEQMYLMYMSGGKRYLTDSELDAVRKYEDTELTEEVYDKIEDISRSLRNAVSEIGMSGYAALKGYDAICVEKEMYAIILNRTKVVILND